MIRRFLLLSVLLHVAVLASWPPGGPHFSPQSLLTVELRGPATTNTPAAASARRPERAAPSARTQSVAPDAEIGAASRPVAIAGEAGREPATNHLQLRLRGMLAEHFLYPPLARRNGWQGRVELSLALDREGGIHALRVARSSGYAILDEDALNTVQRIATRPETRSELSGCACELRVPVLYRLIEG